MYSSSGSEDLWAWIFIHNSRSFMRLRESCFRDCWKDPSVVSVFKNIGKRSTLKTTTWLVFFLFKNLINSRLVDHLEKLDLFSDFQYSFRSPQSTANLLTVISDGIARSFFQALVDMFFLIKREAIKSWSSSWGDQKLKSLLESDLRFSLEVF